MSVLASSFSARRTKPESRCGRKPTVVRITRSNDARTGARLTGARCGGASVPRDDRLVAHPPITYPASATLPPVRNVRLRMAVHLLTRADGCHARVLGRRHFIVVSGGAWRRRKSTTNALT